MASTELGFLALPLFLKGTPEISILLSLPPLDPFAGVTGRRQGMGRLFPRRPLDWWCQGSGPRRRLVGKGWLAVVPALEGLGREGGFQTKDQSRLGPLAGGLALVWPLIFLSLRGGRVRTGLGSRGHHGSGVGDPRFRCHKGCHPGRGSSTRLSQVIT